LSVGEELRVAIELNNPATTCAVQLQTADCHLIGWAPRYLVDDLRVALQEHPKVSATVQRINLPDAPLARRVLIELHARMPADFEPMTSEVYRVVDRSELTRAA